MATLAQNNAVVGEGVMVCARVRPLGDGDGETTEKSVRVLGGGRGVSCQLDEHQQLEFQYGKVFDEHSTNQDVYESIAAPLVTSALDGVHGSILCYGQTGSGKTFTMMGRDGIYSQGEDAGIVPRIFADIFEHISVSDKNEFDFEVRVSAFEIYNDEIYDLIVLPSSVTTHVGDGESKAGAKTFSTHSRKKFSQKKIGIYDTGSGLGLSVVGASSLEVLNTAAALKVIDLALQRRRVAATEMNRKSSRGHCVVLITIVTRNLTTSTSKIGQLYAVDLAGSEAVGKTKVFGKQLSEAGMINKSLLILGRVIRALVAKSARNKTDASANDKGMSKDKNKSKEVNSNKNDTLRIPYRDCKLTRLLQNSLGGNARCALCVNVSPSVFNTSETLSTLRFAASTSMITNKPKRHEVQSVQQLKYLLKECQKTIIKNRSTLSSINDEMNTYAEFFQLIRTSGLQLDSNMSAAAEPLMSLDRKDFRRPIVRKETNVPRVETSAQLGGISSKGSQELGSRKSDLNESDLVTGLRQPSGGELRSALRSQSYVELDDDDQHIAQAKAALSWDEEDGKIELPSRSKSIEENIQVNLHLGALLRSASQED